MKENDGVKKDIKGLLVPFWVFTMIPLLIFEPIKRFLFPNYNFILPEINYWEEVKGILFWTDINHLHHFGFVLWFLPALFWSRQIWRLFKRALRNDYFIIMVSIILYFLVVNKKYVLPLGIDTGILFLVWLSLGNLYYKSRLNFKFVPIAVAVLILIFGQLPTINLSSKVVVGPFYGLFFSLIMILGLCDVSKLVVKLGLKHLTLWGDKSMLILIVHPYINILNYYLVNKFFMGSWLIQIFLSIIMLTFIVMISQSKFMKSILMVIKYIFKNNPLFKIPIVLVVAGITILFQWLTKCKIQKKLFNGKRIWLFPESVVSRMFLYTDIPDKDGISLLRNDVDEKTLFLDIGANIGSFSILIADKTDYIYAFEPDSISVSYCKDNFNLNGLEVKNVCKVALSDKSGVTGFTNYGGSSTINRIDKEGKQKVEMDTLDNWFKKNKLKQKTVVKIDVEGNEEKVIDGAVQTLRSGLIKSMFIEIFDKNSKVFAKLEKYGYIVNSSCGDNYYVVKK